MRFPSWKETNNAHTALRFHNMANTADKQYYTATAWFSTHTIMVGLKENNMTKPITVNVRMIENGEKAATEEHKDIFLACVMRPGKPIKVHAIKDWPGWYKGIPRATGYNYHSSWLIFPKGYIHVDEYVKE